MNTSSAAPNITIVDSSHYDSKETKELKETLKQRDHEISILVSMLKKEKKRNAEGYEDAIVGLIDMREVNSVNFGRIQFKTL